MYYTRITLFKINVTFNTRGSKNVDIKFSAHDAFQE